MPRIIALSTLVGEYWRHLPHIHYIYIYIYIYISVCVCVCVYAGIGIWNTLTKRCSITLWGKVMRGRTWMWVCLQARTYIDKPKPKSMIWNTCITSCQYHFISCGSPLIQAMAWCYQAASHLLGQMWPRLLLCGMIGPFWVKTMPVIWHLYGYIHTHVQVVDFCEFKQSVHFSDWIILFFQITTHLSISCT